MAVKSKSRRQFLKFILASLSTVGALFAFWPFIRSMQPEKKHTVVLSLWLILVNYSNNKIAVTWQGMPIYIIRRTEKQIKALKYNDPFLRDLNRVF